MWCDGMTVCHPSVVPSIAVSSPNTALLTVRSMTRKKTQLRKVDQGDRLTRCASMRRRRGLGAMRHWTLHSLVHQLMARISGSIDICWSSLNSMAEPVKQPFSGLAQMKITFFPSAFLSFPECDHAAVCQHSVPMHCPSLHVYPADVRLSLQISALEWKPPHVSCGIYTYI